ncbi:hypothetical protein [Candidatus Phyllobacterium onerii]|uniref:hypothetical protein n=1 Tax=Candidatus Phyllobacterium onerii TaxID=3020828 RepID=UPI00232B9600|nr:hypothetical protein [Phyllobacterium sp. IY22]
MRSWPGKIDNGCIPREIVQHHGWLPIFFAMAGEPDVIEKTKKGYCGTGGCDLQLSRRKQAAVGAVR